MKKDDNITQWGRILAYLTLGHSLTPIDALEWFGCFRLASRISDLKKAGHDIRMNLVTRNGKTFAEYRLYKPEASTDLFLGSEGALQHEWASL